MSKLFNNINLSDGLQVDNILASEVSTINQVTPSAPSALNLTTYSGTDKKLHTIDENSKITLLDDSVSYSTVS